MSRRRLYTKIKMEVFVTLFLLSAKLIIPVLCTCSDTSAQNLASCAHKVEVEEDAYSIGFMCESEQDAPTVCMNGSHLSTFLSDTNQIMTDEDFEEILYSASGTEGKILRFIVTNRNISAIGETPTQNTAYIPNGTIVYCVAGDRCSQVDFLYNGDSPTEYIIKSGIYYNIYSILSSYVLGACIYIPQIILCRQIMLDVFITSF